MESSLAGSEVYTFVILPVLIFIARVCDVAVGTIRILTLSRGYKLITAVLGFFELMIWLLAIGQVFQNLNNFYCYIAYAGGFATGNYVGMLIEERIALGSAVIRVITKKCADELLAYLKENEHRFTSIRADGASGPVNVIFMVVKRKNIRTVIEIIERYHPKAFYTIEDVREVREGMMPLTAGTVRDMQPTKTLRKGK